MKEQLENYLAEYQNLPDGYWTNRGCVECEQEINTDGNSETCGCDKDPITIDPLDIRYELDSRLVIEGVQLAVTLGGPTVWLKAYTSGNVTLAGAWGSDRAEIHINADGDGIVDYWAGHVVGEKIKAG